MLTAEFFNRIQKLATPRMGTEHMGPLLYSLIRMVRPTRVLEAGMGYTTPFIAKALQDNVDDFRAERVQFPAKNELLRDGAGAAPPLAESLPAFAKLDKAQKLRWLEATPSLTDPAFYVNDYDPKFFAIDDMSTADSAAPAVQAVIDDLGLASRMSLINGRFQGQSDKLKKEAGIFDFIWFDVGGHKEYREFLDEYWPLLNGDGGLLLMHYTLTNLGMGTVIKEMKIRQATTSFGDFELLSLLEPHKMMQNSVSLIRKISQFKDKIYYEVRDVSLQSDFPGLRKAQDANRSHLYTDR